MWKHTCTTREGLCDATAEGDEKWMMRLHVASLDRMLSCESKMDQSCVVMRCCFAFWTSHPREEQWQGQSYKPFGHVQSIAVKATLGNICSEEEL